MPLITSSVHGSMWDPTDESWLVAGNGQGTLFRYTPRTDTTTSLGSFADTHSAAPLYDGGYLVTATGENVVYAFSGTTGTRRILAGGGSDVNAPDGSPATSIRLTGPRGVIYDPARSLVYVADSTNHRVLRIDSAGRVWRLAPTGTFNNPCTLALSATGTLYIADYENRRIAKYDPVTKAVTTVISSANYMWSVSMQPSVGDMYYSIRNAGTVSVIRSQEPLPWSYAGRVGPPTILVPAASYSWHCPANSAGPTITWSINSATFAWSSTGVGSTCTACGPQAYARVGASACNVCNATNATSAMTPARNGCAAPPSPGPADAVFYYSGDDSQPLSAFSVSTAAPSGALMYEADVAQRPSRALRINGTLAPLLSTGLSTLPTGNAQRTVSFWARPRGLPPSRPWAFYPLDAGDANDVSGNGRHGTIFGAAPLSSSGISFRSSGQAMQIPPFGPPSATVSFIFTYDTPVTGTPEWATLLISGPNRHALLFPAGPTTNTLGFFVDVFFSSGFELTIGQPVVITVVMIGTQHSTFINGALIQRASNFYSIAVSPLVGVGNYAWFGQPARGTVRNLIFYDSALSDSSVAALAAWQSGDQTLLSWGTAAASFLILRDASSRLAVRSTTRFTTDPPAVTVRSAPLTFSDNKWTHVAVVHDGTRTTLYIDGSAASTATVQHSTGTEDASVGGFAWLRIGWSLTPAGFPSNAYTGTLDEVRIYARALSASDITTLALPSLPTFPNAANPTAAVGVSRYEWYCLPGAYSPNPLPSVMTRDPADGSWAFTGGAVTCLECPPGQYSFNGVSGCAPCPPGLQVRGDRGGCIAPSPGPTDAVFYYSADASETTAAFAVRRPSGLSFVRDVVSGAGSALSLDGNGTSLAAFVPSLPTGNGARSVAMWVHPAQPPVPRGQPPPISGVWAYYPFSSGAADASGNGRHGTLGGGAVVTPGGLRCVASSDMMTIPALTTSSLTMSVAYTWDTSVASIASAASIVAWPGGNFHHVVLDVEQRSLGLFSGGFRHSGYRIVPGRLTIITLAISSSSYSLYVDGALIQTSSMSYSGTMPPTSICGDPFGQPARGVLDDVVLFNRALSAAEVSALYAWHTGPTSRAIVSWGLASLSPFAIELDSAGKLLTVSWSGGVVTTAVPVVSFGKWAHLAFVHDGTSTATVYANGVVQATLTSLTYATSSISAPLVIGSDASFSGFFSGVLDEVRVYSRALTASEVADLAVVRLPSFPNAVNPPPGGLGGAATTFVWTCLAGYAGPNLTATKNATGDLSWSFIGGPMNCSACPAGQFSTVSSTSCSVCVGGRFGSSPALTTPDCSGTCDAGFYCPAGSTSSRAFACGGVASFCPTGSASPSPVGAGNYSIPLSSPLNQRSGQAACPPNRVCSGGILSPAVDFSAACPTGELLVQLADDVRNAAFGGSFTAATPGWGSPVLQFTVANKTAAAPATCPVTNYVITAQATGAIGTLQLGGTSVDYTGCASGFSMTLQASRSPASPSDALATFPAPDSCRVTIYPFRALRAPALTVCRNLTIVERQAPGTVYGQVISANVSSVASTLVYSVNASASLPTPGQTLPFVIDCNGNLVGTRVPFFDLASAYTATLQATAVGFGESASSTCAIVITILPKPAVPTLSSPALFAFDLSAVGTWVGNVGPVTNNNVASAAAKYVTTTTIASSDTPDAFAIDSQGNVTVKAAVLDATVKSVFTYTVNASDALSWALYPVTISLLPAARPPVTFAQARTAADTIAGGTTLPPALSASHPQGKALTFSLTDPSGTFGVFANGTVYLLPGKALDFNSAPSYSLTFTVTDTAGKIAVAALSITVVETNRAPAFAQPVFNLTVAEGTASGAAFGSAVAASDVNRRDSLAYALASCSPRTSTNDCPFAVDTAAGTLRVAALVGGQLLADRNAAFPNGLPFIYTLTLVATDNGSPRLNATTQVFVAVTSIRPRLSSTAAAIPANSTGGTLVATLLPLAWSAYGTSDLSFSIVDPQPTTAEGLVAFNISTPASSGFLRVAALPAAPAPFVFNTRKDFAVVVRVTDSATGLFADAAVAVTLLHSNRPPTFGAVPATDVPARSRGNILSLASYVVDPDVGLAGIAESFAYSLVGPAPGTGNVDGTFGLNSTTGQLFVANPSAPSFVFNAGTGTGTVYNLTARVCDAGINGPFACALANISLRVVAGSVPPSVSDAAFSLKENSPAGTVLGTVVASDEQGYALTYSIAGGNSEGLFSIGAATGQITVASPIPLGADLDFETRSSYSLVVSVRNAAPTPATSTATVVVTVRDVNEAPTTPATSARTIDENSLVGTAVSGGALTASDVDTADQGRLTFSLLTPGSPFALHPVSGVLTVASATIDFEAQASYTLSYRVVDSGWESGRGNLTADGSIVVTVNNRNDPPSLSDVLSASVDENAVGLSVSTFRAVDQDAGQGMSYAFSRPSQVCWAFSVTSAQASAFVPGASAAGLAVVPFSLPAISTGIDRTILFRVRGSGSIRVAVSSTSTPSTSNRYEILFTRTSTAIYLVQSSGTVIPLVTNGASLLPNSTTAWTHLAIVLNQVNQPPLGQSLTVGTRTSNDPGAAITLIPALGITAGCPCIDPMFVSVTGSAVGTSVSSVCFDSTVAAAALPSFALDAASGTVTTVAALDFEAMVPGGAQYGYEVRATDQTAGNNLLPANLVDYAVLVARVVDKNEAPQWPAPVACPGAPLSTASYIACLSIPENSALNTVPSGTVPSAADPDVIAAQTLVYSSLLDGNAASGSRIFDIAAASRIVSLRQAGVLNFEAAPGGYVVRLTATDTGAPTPQLSASGDVFIALTDVNEPPTIAAASRTVLENSPAGTLVDAQIPASDPDTLNANFSALRFSVVGGDGVSVFNISSASGQLTVAPGAALDFEAKPTYSLTVRVTDGGSPGLTADATVTISVLNANEPPALWGPFTRQISEGAVAPSPVGAPVNATDTDRPTQFNYAVAAGGNATGVFQLDRCSGQISLAPGASLNFETASVFAMVVTVTDDGIPQLSATQTYFLHVLDANDPPVVPDQSRFVPENAAAGTAVGSPVTWSDPDTFARTNPAWTSQTFSIVTGDRGVFAINATTGQISVVAGGPVLLNFEDANANRFNILVRATDGGGLSATGMVTVLITDVNENPTFTDVTLARSIDENCPRSVRVTGENVGTPILATDIDAGQASTLSFSITGGNTLSFFSVVATGVNRGQLQLTTTGATGLDFESVRSFNLTLTVTDSGSLAVSATVLVTLINRNEAPVLFSSISRSVQEDAALNSAVGLPIPASDPEDSAPGLLRFAITSGNSQGVFRIDASTGQISVADRTSLNFEATQSYTLTVTVTDTGSPEAFSLTTQTTISIAVVDVNEAPSLSPAAFTVAENLASGALVGLLTPFASDPDQVDTRAFAILSQENTTSNQAPFALNASGILVVAPGSPLLDFERKSLYTLVVEVRDKGGLPASATVQVRLRNVNEPPSWLAVPVFFARALELQDVGQALVAYARDQDLEVPATNERFTFALTGGNANSIFAVSSSSGQISVVNNNSLTYPTGAPTGPEYNLTVQVTDAGVDGSALSASIVVTVRTIDNNRRPTLAPYTFFVDENTRPGVEVGRVFAADVDSVNGQTVTYTLDPAGANINRLFPFNITTLPNAGTGNVGVGIISLTWDGAAGSLPWANLDFEAPAKQALVGGIGFSTFATTVTATDSHLSRLSATAPITIIVRDVPEAPFFAPSRVPSTATFSLAVPENSPAGTVVAIVGPSSSRVANAFGGLWAADDDITDAGLNLTYAWNVGTPAAVASLFTLNARTGVVSVSAAGAAAGTLDFESARRTQTLTVVATDTTGRTDNATVVVALSDVNEIHTLNGTGIFAPSGAQAARLQIPEGSPLGTVVGRAAAVDVDAGVAGTLVYSLLPDAEADPFAIDPASGIITIAGYGLDFEDKDVWTPTVVVRDSSASGAFTIALIVPVDLLDVNDAAVADVQLVVGEEAAEVAETVIAGVSPHGSTHASMTSLFRTRGGVRVRITGSNLGLTSARLARAGLSASPTTLTVTYGPVGTEYTASSCSIVSNSTAIVCTTVAGSGVNHVWRVALTTFSARAVPSSALSRAMTGYLPPALHNVTLTSASGDSDLAGNAMPTDGSAFIRVRGTNFGPASSSVILRYGPLPGLLPPGGLADVPLPYVTARCGSEVEHDVVFCRSVPGVGGLPFLFRVAVDVSELQVSAPFDDSLVRYLVPSITGVSSPTLDTRGGDSFSVQGTNFGPVGTAANVVYSNAWSSDLASSIPASTSAAAGCAVTVAHTTVACTSSPAVGAGHRLRITVAGQASNVSTPSVALSYRLPLITSIAGPGADKAVTEGGQTVLITGDQFGPATPASADGFPLPGALVPTARYGRTTGPQNASASTFPASSLRYAAYNCRVTSDHTQVTCTTVEGTGNALRWAVTIDGQSTGVFFGGSTNYAAPVVAQYSGTGSRSAQTYGGEEVLIDGFNFGPVGSPVDSVTYGEDGREFSAASCSIQTPHTRLRCLTSVGAGAGLRWLVTIDGQESSTPTTDYGVPVIASISGAGAADASTDGGDVVVLTGTYFATDAFLESVTYGPGGTEYAALDCRVTQNHTEITCATVPGTGRKLRWMVTVRGQTSSPSAQTTSYAAPRIASIAPATGQTRGGFTVVVRGSDFGLAAAASRFDIRVNAFGAPSPSAADLDAHWSALRAGAASRPRQRRVLDLGPPAPVRDRSPDCVSRQPLGRVHASRGLRRVP
jgi:hypothetical protein